MNYQKFELWEEEENGIEKEDQTFIIFRNCGKKKKTGLRKGTKHLLYSGVDSGMWTVVIIPRDSDAVFLFSVLVYS